MKIYSPASNYKQQKLLFASRLLSLNVQFFKVAFDHKVKQFVAQHPNYTLPTLEKVAKDGSEFIFGTHAILLALFQQKMATCSAFEQSQIYQWLEILDKELENPTGVLFLHDNKLSEITEEQIGRAQKAIGAVLKSLEDRLKLRTYIVGHSISAADVSFYFNLKAVEELIQKQMKNLTCIQRWMKNIESIHKQFSQ